MQLLVVGGIDEVATASKYASSSLKLDSFSEVP